MVTQPKAIRVVVAGDFQTESDGHSLPSNPDSIPETIERIALTSETEASRLAAAAAESWKDAHHIYDDLFLNSWNRVAKIEQRKTVIEHDHAQDEDKHPSQSEPGGTASTTNESAADDEIDFRPQHSPTQSAAADDDEHILRDTRPGFSPIEVLARRIEDRRMNRISVTAAVYNTILTDCRKVAMLKLNTTNKIQLRDLLRLRATAKRAMETQKNASLRAFLSFFGLHNGRTQVVECYDRAIELVREKPGPSDDYNEWFHFEDFLFYYTKVESRWPFLRSGNFIAIMVVFAFYFATAIFFCQIVQDEDVCPTDPTGQDRSYYGWLTALYFASATISTVGYGDVSVERGNRIRVFYGIVYMIMALMVAIVAFSATGGKKPERFSGSLREKIVIFFAGKPKPEEPLHVKIRRVRIYIITEVLFQFLSLNLLGMFVSRFFANHSNDPEEQWTWMDSFYWSIQTSTTIGYGDLTMPFELRWFSVFYLTLSTYFVGKSLSQLGTLSDDIDKLKSFFSWESREVSQAMIMEMRSHDGDDSVDQYEFAIASLLNIGTVTAADLAPIMNKFRELAGSDGVIDECDIASHGGSTGVGGSRRSNGS